MVRIMVLGLLLKFGPMSGYEIQQKMQSAQTDKWAYVKPASIYHALKTLDEEGLVALETIEQTGNRSKAIYKITSEGHKEYSKILVKAFNKSSVIFPAALYTALTFMEYSPVEEIVKALEVQECAIQKIYDDMKAGQKQKEEISDIPQNVVFIFNNIYDQCDLQLSFLKELKDYLQS